MEWATCRPKLFCLIFLLFPGRVSYLPFASPFPATGRHRPVSGIAVSCPAPRLVCDSPWCTESPSNRPLYFAGAQPRQDSGGDDAGQLVKPRTVPYAKSTRPAFLRIQVFRLKLSVASEGIDKQFAPGNDPSPAFAASLPPLLSRRFSAASVFV